MERITSPGYSHSYPLNTECIWILNASPGNRINLAFSEFDVATDKNCDLHYLEIREDNGIGKLLGIFCGKEITSITSSSKLWLKFKSGSFGIGKGFSAEYNFIGRNELEGPSGRITSPLYPIPYRRSGLFSWRVTVEMGSIIRIEFRDLQMENIGTLCIFSVKVSIFITSIIRKETSVICIM